MLSVSCIWRLSFCSFMACVCAVTSNDRVSSLEMWCRAPLSSSVSSLALCKVVRLWPTSVVRPVFTRTGLRWSASLLYLLQSDKGVLIDFEQQCCFSFTCYFSLSLIIYYLKCTLTWRQHLGILMSLTLDPKKKKKSKKSPQILCDYIVLKEIVTIKRACIFQIISALFFTSFAFSKSIDCVSVT